MYMYIYHLNNTITRTMLLLLALIIKLLGCCMASNCPDGWMVFEGSCYLFGADHVHFTEAEEYCRHHNAHLVHIGSSAENNFLQGHIRTFFKGTSNYWLGMTDEIAEGSWVWSDNNEHLEYSNWGPNEPNNSLGKEDCAMFDHVKQYQWSDVACTNDNRALCEQRAETSPSVVG